MAQSVIHAHFVLSQRATQGGGRTASYLVFPGHFLRFQVCVWEEISLDFLKHQVRSWSVGVSGDAVGRASQHRPPLEVFATLNPKPGKPLLGSSGMSI